MLPKSERLAQAREFPQQVRAMLDAVIEDFGTISSPEENKAQQVGLKKANVEVEAGLVYGQAPPWDQPPVRYKVKINDAGMLEIEDHDEVQKMKVMQSKAVNSSLWAVPALKASKKPNLF
jgi:hypothetical protein